MLEGTGDAMHPFRLAAAETGRTDPYQDISTAGGVWERFADLLPMRPYCADVPIERIDIRPRTVAILRPLIQLNSPWALSFLSFDIDRAGAAFAHEDGHLPAPSFVSVNPDNGHAHAVYALARPVYTSQAARRRPLAFAAAVERGLRKRLRSDLGYTGLLVKNPLSPRWRTRWLASWPYDLSELAGWLTDHDMARPPKIEPAYGLSRNCDLFDALRDRAYRDVRTFKSVGDRGSFRRHLFDAALAANQEFAMPLSRREVNAIAKSVAHWTWRHFSTQRFSEIQSQRRALVKQRRLALIEEIDP